MGRPFRRLRDGRVTMTVSDDEASILRTLLTQLLELLLVDEPATDPDSAGSADESATETAADIEAEMEAEIQRMVGISDAVRLPTDPALARLFPDGYTGDSQAAAEFRRYTEEDLRGGKQAAARTALATLVEREAAGRPDPPLTLDDEQARSWLATLNDLRLTLGTRLEVTEEYEERYLSLAADDPILPVWHLYLWLGELQESLVHTLHP